MNRGASQWSQLEERVINATVQFAKDAQDHKTSKLQYSETPLHGDITVANLEEKFKLLLSDFQFNLQVLKERDKALDLCEAKLEENHTALFKKDAVISDLKVQVDHLEVKVSQLNGEKGLQQQHFKELVALRDSQLKDTLRNMEHIQEETRQNMVKKELQFQQQLTKITSLNEQRILEAEKEFAKKIEEIKDSLEKELKLKVKELDSKEAEITDLKQENEWTAIQVTSLKEKILLHRSSMAMLEQKHAEKLKNLEETMAEKDRLVLKEMEAMKKRYETLFNTPCINCMNLENEIEKLKEEDTMLREEVKELKQNYAKVNEEKNAKVEEAEKQLSDVQDVIRNLEEHNSALKRAIKAMREAAENDYLGIVAQKDSSDNKSGAYSTGTNIMMNELRRSSGGHTVMKAEASQKSNSMKTQEETTQTAPTENDLIYLKSANHNRNLNHLTQLQDMLRARAKQLIHSLSESKESDDFRKTSSFSHHDSVMGGGSRLNVAIDKERAHQFQDKSSCGRSQSDFERKLNDLETLVEKLKAGMMASIRCKLSDESAAACSKGECC